MNFYRNLDLLVGWCYQFPLIRELERRWYRSLLWRLFEKCWHRRFRPRYGPSHLYETVISNDRVWMKLQAPCWSSKQAAAYFESRFNGTPYTTPEGHQPVTPFRLSACSIHIANWESIVKALPQEWDRDEYRIEQHPYPWCESLTDGCDCHASIGKWEIVCSDIGLQRDGKKKQAKTTNTLYDIQIKELEIRIEDNDEAQRKKRSSRTPNSVASSEDGVFVYPRVPLGQGTDSGRVDVPAEAMNKIGQMVSAGFYCPIENRHHPYGQQPIRSTVASLNAACEKMASLDDVARRSNMRHMVSVAEHYLRLYQSEECAMKAAWGDVDIPRILYKYIPKERIGNGPPTSLRATQLLALNDDMECNVITMKDTDQSMLDMLRALKEKSKEHLRIKIPWHELLKEPLLHGSPRLSPYIQKFLNSLVGVISLTTDICVPTMWAHYAKNTGIVVGYDTKILRTLGFELQPVIYSEIAPIYRPLSGDRIILDFVDREHMESEEKTGQKKDGLRILTSATLGRFNSDWKSLSRLLFVKGMSWAYEREVRLLVDLKQTRDTRKKDSNGWPIKVIDIPPSAIVEIYGGTKTMESDIIRAIEYARGRDKSGLFVGRLSSHAFRMQRTGGTRH